MTCHNLHYLPSTRKEAKAIRSLFYFTGKPCVQGHVAKRYHHGDCVECHKLGYKQWSQDNPQRKREADKRRYQKHGDAIRARKRVAQKKYRAENPEKVKAALRKWSTESKEAVRAHCRKVKAKRRNAPGNHTAKDIQRLLLLQGFKCANCNCSVRHKRHVDHIIPLALGGRNGPENLQILCPPCNLKKQAKDPLVWARENGRLL